MAEKVKVPTRKKILAAAEEVFSANGFHKTLVEDIAKKAGLGKGTMYLHFKNKTELFQSLIFETFDQLKEYVTIRTKKQKTTKDKLKMGIRAYLEFFKQHKMIFKILIFEHSEVGCDDHSECFEKFAALISILEKFVKTGIKDGTFKKVQPDTLTFSMLGSVNYIIFKWIMSKEDYDLLDELDAIYEIILKGAMK